MEDRELEAMLERVLKQDLSLGTDAFRDALLQRCLSELDPACRADDLADGDLELLAAAGTGLPEQAKDSDLATLVS